MLIGILSLKELSKQIIIHNVHKPDGRRNDLECLLKATSSLRYRVFLFKTHTHRGGAGGWGGYQASHNERSNRANMVSDATAMSSALEIWLVIRDGKSTQAIIC